VTLETEARRATDRELAALRDPFGEFPVEETTVENDPEYYRHGLDAVREAGMLADAGAWVVDDADRVLLVRHPDEPGAWGTPGGRYEAADDSLASTAVREVREETDIECEVTGVWRASRKRIDHREDDRSYPMLTVEFEARGSGEPTAGGDDEVLEARWFDAAPDRAVDEVVARLRERVDE
jgi:ADP-ribose pyrophosphatase YjhB (NUDIX family)